MSHVYNEVKETAGKMISGLRTYSDDFALKYLESYIATMVETYVKDDTERTMIQMCMLKIGIDSLIENKLRTLTEKVK